MLKVHVHIRVEKETNTPVAIFTRQHNSREDEFQIYKKGGGYFTCDSSYIMFDTVRAGNAICRALLAELREDFKKADALELTEKQIVIAPVPVMRIEGKEV
jgi:hypothetical protein